ncbi:MAG: hypothetical protein ACI4MQ_05855 [Candidatus Coproplasma sp.]
MNETVQKMLGKDDQACRLAKGLFDGYHEVTTLKENGSLDLSAMTSVTQSLIEQGAENIFNTTFSCGGLNCIVDILHREKDGYAIYKVIGAYDVRYIDSVDIAYQKYVLQKCGVKVTATCVACLDIDKATLDISKSFKFSDVSLFVNEEEKLVEKALKSAEKFLADPNEPEFEIGSRCTCCPFWDYCTSHCSSTLH